MDFIKAAHSLADQAGELARQAFRSPCQASLKADQSPVTEVDLAIEMRLRESIQLLFPDHGIWGEEYEAVGTAREYVWVIDPIDGTRSFITGKPLFCTLIALLHFGVPILGVIDQPILRDRWVGIQGQPTTWNGKPCKPIQSPINHLRLSCTTPEMFENQADRLFFDKIKARAHTVSYGGDAYAYGLLAGGCIDLIVEAGLQPYDVAALIPVIQGMGGKVTDWEGRAVNLFDFKGKIIAAGNALDFIE